jgi:hypothetical protein
MIDRIKGFWENGDIYWLGPRWARVGVSGDPACSHDKLGVMVCAGSDGYRWVLLTVALLFVVVFVEVSGEVFVKDEVFVEGGV